ncbi:hypothetical protein [Coprobacter tertius]|uniref:Tetratricopeptide repeat protein n=1 Tax=Coprobacter tertius TaxID=2944915 RepID=A0ABT1MJU1_9BACT|nr:hypothetical protein [Coprobacter tertius]MCP9612131.1 hypothetical protein [Coprobacter tertius]
MIKKILLLFMFMITSLLADAAIDYKATAFKLYINGKMNQWQSLIDKMNSDVNFKTTDDKLEILNYYYGLVGHLIDKKEKDEASKCLTKAMKLADELYIKNPDNAVLLGLISNLTGFQIALSPIKATVLAKGMLSKSKKSYALAPGNPEVIILHSNIQLYMPEIFGGDKQKALSGYKKALKIMELNPKYMKNNWMYIQLLTSIGLVEEKLNNLEAAKAAYKKILDMYPDYAHVRDIMYPRLLERMKS